jgi:SWI/SNF chromatin-remodeling complex subunit SWI1
LERELETHGGRDLHILEDDWSQRKPLRDVNEWGRVDVEAVTMSLRSRISTEVSYALTTLTLISTMKGQAPGTGFPIAQCEDLMEELLDLLEEEAFDGVVDALESSAAADSPTITHREIINAIHEQETQPFASLEHRQGAKERKQGPKPRIIPFLWRHTRGF